MESPVSNRVITPETGRGKAFLLRLSLALLSFAFYGFAVLTLHQEQVSSFEPDRDSLGGALSHAIDGAPLGQEYAGYRDVVAGDINIQQAVLNIEHGKVKRGVLLPTIPDKSDGIGHPIFSALAMQLFGPRLSSLNYFFLLLMGVSTLAYIIRFQDERMLLVPVVFCCLTLMLLTPLTSAQSAINEAPIGGKRYFIVAAFLAAFHIFWEIRDRARGRSHLLMDMFLLAIQVGMIVLAIYVRRAPSYLLGPAILFALIGLYASRHRRAEQVDLLRKVVFASAAGAAIAAAFAFSVPAEYIKSGRLTGVIWHRAFHSFEGSPEWPFPGIASRYDCSILPPYHKLVRGGFDLNSDCVWVAYPANKGRPLDDIIGDVYTNEYERVLRDAVFETIRTYPRQVFDLLFYYKPIDIRGTLVQAGHLKKLGQKMRVVPFAVGQGIILLLFAGCLGLAFVPLRNLLGMSALMLLFFVSAIPSHLIAWTSLNTAADLISFEFSFIATLLVAAVAGLIEAVRRRGILA